METRIYELLESIGKELQGHRAFIQIQVADKYYTKRIGDLNELIDHPEVMVRENTSSFLDWMEEQWRNRDLKFRTRLNHRSAIRLLRQFDASMTFADLTSDTVNAFDRWMQDRNYKTNTIAKIMGTFRQYVRMALDEELIIKDPFRRYKMRSEKTHKEHLSERDIRKIEGKVEELEGTEREVARGFLLSCYTGLRYSDVCQFTKKHIRKVGAHRWLEVTMQKTRQVVKVPLDKMFGGKALGLISEGKISMPSNSRCNIILSRLMKKVGIRKHITMHCGRVTCATLCLNRGMPITTIQTILGHQDIKTTRIYAHSTDSLVLRDVARCWKN